MSKPRPAKSGAERDPSVPPAGIEGQLRDITDRANEETDQNQQKIASAKDKAQLSTTGSLSLTLIIVLKQLLEDVTSGLGDVMMFISLTLVILCILFQIVIALLTINIYSKKQTAPVPGHGSPPSIKTYRSAKYSERLFQTDHELQQERLQEQRKATTSGKEPASKETCPLTANVFQLFRDLDSSDSKQPWYVTCIPCLRLSESEIEENYSLNEATRRLHDILTVEKFKATLEFVEVQVGASSYPADDGKEKEDDAETEERQKSLEEKWKKLNALTTQHKLLDLQLDLQGRRRAFSDLFRLQQYLTYLTYVVFILNSFITGFGLTRGIEGGADNSTVTAPVSS